MRCCTFLVLSCQFWALDVCAANVSNLKYETELQLREEGVKFRMLGLSATPGSNKDAIQVRC